jgi:hypothetical protein
MIVAPVEIASVWEPSTSVAGIDEQFFPALLPKFVHGGYLSLPCLRYAVSVLVAPLPKNACYCNVFKWKLPIILFSLY